MSSLAATLVLEYLQQQTAPVTPLQVKRDLKCPLEEVSEALDELAQTGQAFALVQGKQSAYTVRQPLDLAAEALALVVSKLTTPRPAAAVARALKPGLRPWFNEALARLVVQGKAWWWMLGKQRLLHNRPMRPSDTLHGSKHTQVRLMLAEANRHRTKARTMDQFLAWLDATDETPKPVASARLTAELLHAWYQADRAKTGTSMVPIPHTFQHYERWASANHLKADIVDFRQMLESLYNSGAAILEPCERPHELPHHERELQVPLTLGPPGYYWCPVV